MKNETSWYRSSVSPARIGWYQVTGEGFQDETWVGGSRICMRYWNGESWEWMSTNTGLMKPAAMSKADRWRGLAAPNNFKPIAHNDDGGLVYSDLRLFAITPKQSAYRVNRPGLVLARSARDAAHLTNIFLLARGERCSALPEDFAMVDMHSPRAIMFVAGTRPIE